MKKTILYSLALSCLVVFSGCNGKMGQFEPNFFTTNPNPLEAVGGNVPATVTGNIPAKFFKKNAQVTVTPVLVFGQNEANSAPITYQGEKVRGNYPTVSYDGGTMTIPVNYAYQPDMLKSELYLAFNVQQGNKQYALPRVKVADGIIATSDLANAGAENPALTPDKFQRFIEEAYKADIHFLINQANVRPSELTTVGVEEFNQNLVNANNDKNRVIENINIASYASPEGSYDFNNRLAENREKNTSDYLNKQLKKNEITEFGDLTASFTAEDWEGFQELVGQSDIQDKNLILSVLGMYKDPEEREREIRNLSSVFNALKDNILPQLRRSRLTAAVKVIGKSDEEITNLYNTNPSALSVEELLYAATLTNDEARKADIYATVVRLFPDDYRGYNNLGMSQFKQKDFNAAAANFNQAAKRAPQSSEVKLNQALIALQNGDLAKAKQLIGAAGSLPEANSALGYTQLAEGKTAAAASAYKGVVNNNAALAQILNKDYSTAANTLSKITNPDATTYYLLAVLGARTNNADQVKNGLSKAIQLDPALAQRAVNDLEFGQFDITNYIR